ncbi:replication initiation factor domain-containing protein [Hydrogenophaga electricum]|uniref:Replication initiation protein-like C-terminal domain-containing protein n=1 Tax=Hydrogenophaga electricum TaxID=1230953 RepID=A0ABQ6C234_9BURK|nr:replication initiation factor domain-containing protein [Hydrogenophaga electricum]GLS13658.1 hypothetical protein GCM10007935_10880 [Hydrogenophaga electricum]
MTRAKLSDLVLDGNEVAVRLKAERRRTASVVHVDWVRFTAKVKRAPAPAIDDLFPLPQSYADRLRLDRMSELLRALPDADFTVSTQAKALADQVCEALGPDFSVCPEVRKGHDFYRFRWSIVRNDVECGWVGYLASGDSPRQQAQASTLHANVYGTACTFARPGFNHRLADLVRKTEATITRVDLALDFFDGFAGGMDRVVSDYMAGLMDVYGKRPVCNQVGRWPLNRERSFYFGSREAGKQTNVYEKGHQLFGWESGNPWVRVELRYGNKLRVLDADVLNRPADYFAGASEWHAQVLREAEGQAVPEPIKVQQRLPVETIKAEVTRNVRWFSQTALATAALVFRHVGADALVDMLEGAKLPGRLAKFKPTEVRAFYEQCFKDVSRSGTGRPGFSVYQAA